ncbi:MAG: SRPBCC family protein [Flavobacteriaceae bacterium]
MKYTTEITIGVPIEEFIQKLDNPENMKHWQGGFIGYKQMEGDLGKEGAKMELNYQMGKRGMTLVETILKRNLPHEFHATYETKGVCNIQKNYFKKAGVKSTRWISESEFQFSGFMMKVFAFLMPGSFKKQSFQYMKDFKAFAEEGKSVTES